MSFKSINLYNQFKSSNPRPIILDNAERYDLEVIETDLVSATCLAALSARWSTRNSHEKVARLEKELCP